MSDQESSWQQFADDVGGRLETEETWGFLKVRRHRVVAPVGRWSLTVDGFNKPLLSWLRGAAILDDAYTRMTASYEGAASFRFRVYSARLFARLRRRLGAHDIKTGDAQFDGDFILNGGDAEQIQRLFASAQLRHAVRYALSAGRFELKEGGQLYFQQLGVIEEFRPLMDLHRLFEETLSQLQEIDAADRRAERTTRPPITP